MKYEDIAEMFGESPGEFLAIIAPFPLKTVVSFFEQALQVKHWMLVSFLAVEINMRTSKLAMHALDQAKKELESE